MRFKHFSIVCLAVLLASCANRGIGPQGGPKDTIPPKPLAAVPEAGTLHFAGNQIEITFDEYIQLNNVQANLLMSPPQQNPPELKARGKKLVIRFVDDLHDSTTYTLDFGDAICDYREKTPLHGYSYYFSTGDEIDTLVYTGRVYDAATLNPMSGILVGIHRDTTDTAFTRLPFMRIAKTDSAGYFRIGNIHAGSYRIYAVDDISRDYRLTPGESCAFGTEPISVPADSGVTGSLLLFKESQQKLYLQRAERKQQHAIQLQFSAPSDSVPQIEPIGDSLNYYTQVSAHRDTVTLWLLDSASIKHDSIFLAMRYRRTDSLYRLEWFTDTVRAIWRAPKMTPKLIEQQERINRNRRLELRSNARKDFDVFDTLRLTCSTPIARIALDSIRLTERIDTVVRPIPFTIADHDSITHELRFLAELQPGGNYELLLDSGALHDVYGITHIKASYGLLVKKLSDYSTLRVKLNPFLSNARIQVLNSKDIILRELPAAEEGALFEHLKPDTYYLRLYIDENEDGQWTNGDWSKKRQPEPIYYFPEKVQTKSNWDFEEEWNYQAAEQMKAKPKELVKIVKSK